MRADWIFLAALAVLTLDAGGVPAQEPALSAIGLAAAAAVRFPQPVLVGSLIGRTVLQPLESQPILGYVAQVVRSDDGVVRVVMRYGGLFGIGSRLIAVPVDAMALVGDEMMVMEFTPEQLDGFPTFDGGKAAPIAPADMIRVGLAKPVH